MSASESNEPEATAEAVTRDWDVTVSGIIYGNVTVEAADAAGALTAAQNVSAWEVEWDSTSEVMIDDAIECKEAGA